MRLQPNYIKEIAMHCTCRHLASLILASALPLLACGDDGDDAPVPTESARLRVVHASPDAPAVDIYAAGVAAPLISDLSYGEVSAYLEVDAGSYNLQVRPAGQPTATPVYETGPVTLAADAQVTAVAAGFIASSDGADRFRVLPLVEGFSTPGAGQAQVRIVHASADAPTVGVDVGNDDPAAPEVASLARFADTGAAGVALPAGQALQIGIAAGGARVTAFTTPALPASAELFVIAAGRLADLPRTATGFSLIAVGPDGLVGVLKQNPVVYALHASPDAPAVDIRNGDGDGLVAGNLAFGGLARAQVPPGQYTLEFYTAGSQPGTPAAAATTPALTAGDRYLAIASGFLSPVGDEAPFQLIAIKDELEVAATGARVRAIHASPDAPAVNIGTLAGDVLTPVLVPDLAFPNATAAAGLAVPAASLRLGVAVAPSTTAAAAFGVTTADGLRAYAVAAGALSPREGEQGFRLLVVNASAAPWSVAAVLPEG
jgi:hypothetical protein